MRSAFIAVGAILAATAAAQPHGQHQHRHAKQHAKRQGDVVWVTENVDVYETQFLTATVWVDQNGNTISPAVTGTASGSPARSTSVSAGIFNEPEQNSTEVAPVVTPTPAPTPTPASTQAPNTTTIQVSSVEQPASSVEQPAPSSSSVQVPPPAALVAAPSTTLVQVASSSAAPVAVASSSAPVAPVVESSSTVAPVASTVASVSPAATSASSGSSTGECSSGSPCNGDITYYEAGLGACGETTDGETDLVVALPVGMMGAQSNGNPYCGKTVTISKNGATVQAKVVDKCMGCVGTSLDLSNAAFSALGVNFDVGRTTADWYFN